MKTYRVFFTFSHGGYYDIAARSTEAAEEIAIDNFLNQEDPSYRFLEGGGFEVLSIEEPPSGD